MTEAEFAVQRRKAAIWLHAYEIAFAFWQATRPVVVDNATCQAAQRADAVLFAAYRAADAA